MNNDKYIYFVLLQSPNGKMKSNYGFKSYSKENGSIAEYHEGRVDRNGDAESYKVTFSRRHRVVPVHKSASGKDRDGEKIMKVDYFRGHPECEGSPNANGRRPKFKEMNADKDIDIALEANKVRREAETLAANLTGENLKNAAALIGKVGGTQKSLKFAVMQAAFHDPDEFLAKVNDDQFKARGFIQRAIKQDVLKREGFIIKFGGSTIGIDEDEAIHAILKDKDLYNSIDKLLKTKK